MVRAAVMTGPDRPVEVQSFADPSLEPGAALLDTLYSEVCGTDCHLRQGKLAGVPYPIIPGHVSVGRIAEMERPLSDVDGVPFEVGQAVAFLDVHETCGLCWYCTVAKASTRCPHRRVYGITYSAAEGLLGGWSEKIYLRPGVRILHLPEEVSPETYIAAGCGLPTAFHAIERSDMRMGDTVVVQGTGPVGLAAIALARMRGAGQVIAVGAPQIRLDLAAAFGADHTIDIGQIDSSDRAEAVRQLTHGRGADVVIEASGNPQAMTEGLAMARDSGMYVVVGQYTDHGAIEINPHLDVNKPHLEVRGCWGVDFSHLYRAIKMLARSAKDVPWTDAISRRYALHETDQAMDDVAALQVVKAVIEPNPGQGPSRGAS